MKVSDIEWKHDPKMGGEDHLYSHLHDDGHRFTILNRMTGFGHRDIETGYRDPEGKFWLASGHFDIRYYGDLTIEQAIETIKENANTCVGI